MGSWIAVSSRSAKPPSWHEKQTLEEQLANLDAPGSTGAQKLADFLERLDSAYSLYQSGTPEEKRELIATFTSNWLAAGKEIDFTPLPEVRLVAERAQFLFGRVERDSPRTARSSRLGSGTQQDRSRILDVLLSQLTKLLAVKLGAD